MLEIRNWIRIRSATKSDIDDLHDLDKRCFTLPWSRDDIEADMLKNALSSYLLAETKGKTIAYVCMWVFANECHIMSFAVDPDRRKQGIATMLMQEMLKRARLTGAESFTLEVRRSNAPAIGLYEKFGFRIAGYRPAYYEDNKEDAAIMWKFDGVSEKNFMTAGSGDD